MGRALNAMAFLFFSRSVGGSTSLSRLFSSRSEDMYNNNAHCFFNQLSCYPGYISKTRYIYLRRKNTYSKSFLHRKLIKFTEVHAYNKEKIYLRLKNSFKQTIQVYFLPSLNPSNTLLLKCFYLGKQN